MIKNPYILKEPSVISFSGGRSSGFMLHKILEAHGGRLPNSAKVVFANTGREMPQTLDFVKDCEDRWGVEIIWIESDIKPYTGKRKGKKWEYDYKVVTHETASRNGEPFTKLIEVRNYAPNVMARFCTTELKVNRIAQVGNKYFGDDWVGVIGLRSDEPRRVARLNSDDSYQKTAPMSEAGHTIEDVMRHWRESEFDLKLQSFEGNTDMGNCDLCFLKGPRKKQSIINMHPHLAKWWVDIESTGKIFRKDQPSYAQMLANSESQIELFELPDIECMGCTD